MKKPIVKYSEDLKQPCLEVTEEELPSILQDLEDSFVGLKGYGLAANQIGINKQVAIIRVGEIKIDIINPTIISKEGKQVFPKEGCLSYPGIWIDTDRYSHVIIETGLPNARKQYYSYGLEAAILQHEIDHLKGITIFQRKHKSR